jgi:hypothetical protein
MRKYILLTVLLISLGISWVVFAQTKVKSRTETVTEYDKKAKKFITHKESYQTYNANGEVLEEFGYDKKGVVNKHIKYEYNSFGKKTKEIHYKDNTTSIKFLVERWKQRVINLPISAGEKDITKFWILNFAANTSGRESIYNSYPATDLTNIETKVANAITLYKGATGQLNPATQPSPPSIITFTQRTIGERGWDVKINDPSGQKWTIYLITYRVLAPASCAFGPTESNLRIFEPPLNSNVQETFISLEEIQFDIDCDDLVEKIRFNIDLFPILDNGSPDTSRTGKTELFTSTVFN